MRKKFSYLIISILLFAIIAGCSGNPNNSVDSISDSISISSSSEESLLDSSSELPIDIESIATEYLESVIPEKIASNIVLPTTIPDFDFTIAWMSNKPETLTNSGVFIKPLNEAIITLTATFVFRGVTHNIQIFVVAMGYTRDEMFETVLATIEKPFVDFNNLVAPLLEFDSFFNASLSWKVSGSSNVKIEDNTLVLDRNAFGDGDTFTLTVTATIEDRSESRDFEYVIPPASNVGPVHITVFDDVEFNWNRIAGVSGYDVEFVDLNKTYRVNTNTFSLETYNIPTNSLYKVKVTPVIAGAYFVKSAETIIGNVSSLPKVTNPTFSFNHNANNKATLLQWDKVPTGATYVRIYSDGVLMRTVEASAKQYSLYYNGIIVDPFGDKIYELSIQFVGNYTTHQSSDFTKVKLETTANSLVGRPTPPTLQLNKGRLEWNYVGNYGYQIAFNDFFSYFTPYATQVTGDQSLSLGDVPNLAPGKYNVKIKTMTNDAGCSSYFSDPIEVTIGNFTQAGPADINVNEDLLLTWNSVSSLVQYDVEITTAGIKRTLSTAKLDLEDMINNGLLSKGTHDFKIHAWVYNSTGATRTKISSFTWTYTPSPTKLAAPKNVKGDYNGFSWDAVVGATGYEVIYADKSYIVNSTEFNFANKKLPMDFAYNVKVKALANTKEDYSIYSALKNITTNLKNVATTSSGAKVTAIYGKGYVGEKKQGLPVPTASGTNDLNRVLDGNLTGTNWQYPTSGDTFKAWEGNAYADYLEINIDLGKSFKVYQILCAWNTVNAAKYTVEVSSDNSTWTKIYTHSETPARYARTDMINLMEPTSMRYVRINCTARGDAGFAYNIYGFAVNTL